MHRDGKKEREEKGFALLCIYCDFLSLTSFLFYFCFTLDILLEQIQIFRRDLHTLCLIGGYIHNSTSYPSVGDIKYKNFRFEEYSPFLIFIITLHIRFFRRTALPTFLLKISYNSSITLSLQLKILILMFRRSRRKCNRISNAIF